MESRWRGWRGCRSPRRQHRSSYVVRKIALPHYSYFKVALSTSFAKATGAEVLKSGRGKPMAVLFDSGERPTPSDAVVSHHHPVLAFRAFSLEVSNERINNGLEFAVHNLG